MSDIFKPGLKIGILGGGQLARMLALSAHNLGAVPYILSMSEDDPAQQVVEKGFLGNPNDEASVRGFARYVDVITFESEFINCDTLAEAVPQHKKKVFPSIACIRTLQDRKSQKELLDNHKIPTAPWAMVTDEASLLKLWDTWAAEPFVIKKRRNGYDGYGTYTIKTKKNLTDFLKQQENPPEGFIAEKFVHFRRELACIFSRNKNGDILQYPLVESFQKDARCFWVKGPMEHPKFTAWSKKFKSLLTQIDYVGTIGVELFDDGTQLLVNELAPRVHNTGHYSLNTPGINQFEAHLRCLLGMDLPTALAPLQGFAMVNLLGTKGIQHPSWVVAPEAHLHWYGKSENRAGRKMGHINTLGKSPNDALKRALSALKGFKV